VQIRALRLEWDMVLPSSFSSACNDGMLISAALSAEHTVTFPVILIKTDSRPHVQ
jgi:hypothetical protein